MTNFHLFQRVRILVGQYAGKEGVITRILTSKIEGSSPYQDNAGIYIEVDGVVGLKRYDPEEIEHLTSELYRAKQKLEHLEMRDMY